MRATHEFLFGDVPGGPAKKGLDSQPILGVTIGYIAKLWTMIRSPQSQVEAIKQEVKPVWLITHP